MTKKKPGKPPAATIPSDDCEVTVGGVTYHPHEGEVVVALTGMRVADYGLQRRLQEIQPELAALAGEEDEERRGLEILGDRLNATVLVLQQHILSWTWTGDDGQPLPQPADDPAAFGHLRLREMFYLVAAVQGETPDQAKNGSRPSRTTSSASAPTPSRN